MRYTEETKDKIYASLRAGVSTSAVARENNIPYQTAYGFFKKMRAMSPANKAVITRKAKKVANQIKGIEAEYQKIKTGNLEIFIKRETKADVFLSFDEITIKAR
jgi:hypothetical protein